MARIISIPLLAIIVLASTPTLAAKRRAANPPSEADTTATEWLQRHSVAFATAETKSGTSDLAAFGTMVGDARIVALGEATHGSHEFFAMKSRLVDYLVNEKGFTVFAMETLVGESDDINNYILNGVGDPAALLRNLQTFVWNTQEVFDLVQWMREYNLTRGDRPPIMFAGIDGQVTARTAALLTSYLQRVDASNASTTMKLYDCYRPYETNWGSYAGVASSTKDQCRANVTQLRDSVASKHDAYMAASSESEYQTALHFADVLVQAEDMNAMRATQDTRDVHMAANVEWLSNVARPDAKVIVWAHNGHVAAGDDYLMGHFLRQTFGTSLLIAGFSFDHGDFWSSNKGITKYTVTSPNDGWEAFFRAAGKPRMFIDLRNASAPAARTMFATERRRMWEVGAFYTPENPNNFRPSLILIDNWDVVIWFDQVTATQLRN